ncbi:MAG TPA: SRPBCC family protein [Candidatus Eisenbacteria bacterium]
MTSRTPIRAADGAVLSFLREDVWRVVADVRAYPIWFPRSIRARVERADELIGTRVNLKPWGGRAFTCRVVEVHPLRGMVFEYDGGFIQGRGEWSLEPVERGTRVSYALDAVAVGRLAAIAERMISLSRVHSAAMQGVLGALGREVARRATGRSR